MFEHLEMKTAPVASKPTINTRRKPPVINYDTVTELRPPCGNDCGTERARHARRKARRSLVEIISLLVGGWLGVLLGWWLGRLIGLWAAALLQ